MCANSLWALDIPDIFSDNMMLQQQSEAKMWGWAKKSSTVKITTSWDGKQYSATADKKTGRWDVKVSTPAASFTNYTITVEGDGETRVIKNVLVGEVWFCSGQSNMEMPLGGFWNCPVEGANEAIAESGKYKDCIRVATVDHQDALEPKATVGGKWDICEPVNASKFSACAYFFARTLTDLLGVPVGVINCSWGGSAVEGWMPKEILLTYPDKLVNMDNESYHRKMVMYYGMICPLAGYTIKGFLWNQGESNVGRPVDYIERFSTMTRHWREIWNQPGDKLPIYSVELPPFVYGDGIDGTTGPEFRVAQHQIPKVLENSGCVSTADLIYDHEKNQIHGCKKMEIGQRLAYMVAVKDYGMQGIVCDAPEFEFLKKVDATADDNTVIAGSKVASQNVSGQVLLLYFSNSTDGFDRMSDISGFEAQDADGNWHDAIVWASSSQQNDKRQGCLLKLACPEAKEIKAVRYLYKNFVKGELHNLRGLPVVPFMAEVK